MGSFGFGKYLSKGGGPVSRPVPKFRVGQVIRLHEDGYHKIAARYYGAHPTHIAERVGWFYDLDGWGDGIQPERYLRALKQSEVWN